MFQAITLLLLSIFTFTTPTENDPVKQGIWRGVISYGDAEVPFNFNMDQEPDGNYVVTLINGEERIPVRNIKQEGDSIFIPMHLFHTEIRAKVSGQKMTGVWKKYYRRGYEVPFSAEYGYDYRYKADNKAPKDFSGRWVTWLTNEDGEKSGNYWITLIEQDGNNVKATVITSVGDFRFMEGIIYKNEIFFSSFDGVHAFVFNGKMKGKQWEGMGITDAGEYSYFFCEKNDEIELKNSFEIVEIEPKTHKADFLFYEPDGTEVKASDPYYNGKVLIVQVFGTWCANSMDATGFLKEFYENYQDKGVEIIGIAYETSANPAYGFQRINNMKEITEITYPVAYAGSWSKSTAAEPFPVMDRLQAFPTLVIIDKEGYINSVVSYFTGPATGEYYDQFKERFTKTVETLLEE